MDAVIASKTGDRKSTASMIKYTSVGCYEQENTEDLAKRFVKCICIGTSQDMKMLSMKVMNKYEQLGITNKTSQSRSA